MSNSKATAQQTLYEVLIRMSQNKEERERALPYIGKAFEVFTEYETIDYPIIFRLVSDSSLTREELDNLLEILILIENEVIAEHLKAMSEKMRRHFLLSYEQNVNFDRLKQEFDRDISDAKKELKAVNSDLLKAEDAMKEFSKSTASIYAQFITVLGIFTAIVFSMFGGLKLLESTLSALHSLDTWKAVIFFSMFAIATLCMLFILMRWVSIIVDNVTQTRRRLKVGGILSSHFGFTVALVFFMYLMFIAALFSNQVVLSNFQNWITGISNYLVLGFILLLPVTIFSLFLIVYIYNKKPTAPK